MTDQMKMTITSKAYGEVTIEERQIVDFPVGLFGFEHLHQYALLDSTRPPLFWLQSLEEPGTAFVVVNPYVLVTDYVLDIDEGDIAEIGNPSGDELLVFAIITFAEHESRISCNLQGPLIINRLTRKGRQAISLDPRWSIRHSLLGGEG